MKYLIKRNDFLRNAKRLDEKSEFLRDSKLSGNRLYQDLVKEEWDSHGNTGSGSGPLANDIGWHDSLVGRFLNHLVRKAKVAANLMRIKPLIRRLEGEFDRIAAEGVVYKMDEEQKSLYIKSILYSFFWELKEAVEKGYEVRIIKNLTITAIENLENLEDEQLEERTKETMLRELQLFLEFLEQFDENEGEKDPSISEEENNEGSGTGEDGILTPIEAEKLASTYPVMIKNLEALKLILANYKKVQIGGTNTAGMQSANKTKKYITKEGDTIELIQKNTVVNKKNLKSIDILNKNLNVLQNTVAKFKTPDEKIKAPLPAGLALVMEGLFIIEAIGDGAGKERHNVSGAEDHLTQAYTKLKKDIEVLESTKEKGIGIDFKFLEALVSNSKNTESKNLIKSLYNDINRYLVGDRKATIQEKDPLYKESYEYLMPRTAKNPNGGKIQVVAEKIARFAKRALQFDGENLYGGLGDLKVPLQSFVETTKQLMKTPIVKEEEPKKEEPKKEEGSEKITLNSKEEGSNEKSLFKYDRFISYIKEAEEKEEDSQDEKESKSASDPRSGMSTSEKIQDYFDKKCMTVKEFTMEKTEFKKVQANFEELEKDKDGLIIDGYDPIIEILKLFNRAYKLYMSKHITKRSTGPGVSTSEEYTEFGPNSFRNNKIFDVWENAVLDIMKDRKYQFIFDKKTKLRVGDELRPNGGANLRKFMTDILDGDKLYKDSSQGQGAQAKLLDKYFGAPDEEGKLAIAKGTGFKGDFEANSEIQEDVEASAIEIRARKSTDLKDDVSSRSFLIINAKNEEGKNVQRSFLIQEINNGVVYMQYSKTFAVFKAYLDRISGGKKKLESGDFEVNSAEKKEVLYTKVRTEDFSNLLLQPGKIEIGSLDNDKKVKTEKLEVVSSYWISNKQKDGKEVIFTIPEDIKEQLYNAITSAGNNKGIVNLIEAEVNAKIKPNKN